MAKGARASIDSHLKHYLEILGLAPGAKAEEVATAYFVVRKSLMKLGTEEADEKIKTVDHAYRIVKARYKTRRRELVRRQVNRFLIAASLTLAVLALYSGFQFTDRFRWYFEHFEPGEVVYRHDDNSRFGEILAYEEGHPFPTGVRQDAYQVRLYPSGNQAWVSARTARRALETR